MMKRLLTSILTLSLFAFAPMAVQAQVCTPAGTGSVTGVSPETLAPVCVGTMVNQVLQLTVPSDTVIDLGFGPAQTVDLEYAEVDSVVGLPEGISAGCHNAECRITQTGEDYLYGCILLSGTPTSATAIPNTVTIYVTFFVSGFTAQRTFDFTFNAYAEDSPQCITASIQDFGSSMWAFSAYPNPAKDEIIQFTQEATNLKIYNANGEVVFAASKVLEFNASQLESGIYFVKADEGTTRLVIE